jgi:hypothetical protein
MLAPALSDFAENLLPFCCECTLSAIGLGRAKSGREPNLSKNHSLGSIMPTLSLPDVRHKLLPKMTFGHAQPAIAAICVLGISLALAGVIYALQSALQQQTERAVLLTGAFFAAVLAAVPGVYVLSKRRAAIAETASLVFLSTMSLLLLAIYFFWVGWYVFFPADIWIWSEGDFVNDMLKFATGYPLYSSPVNHDSFAYVPGPQLLTYLVARLAGGTGSIPAYRVIQLCYTAIAAFVATLSCRRILRLAWPESQVGDKWLWNMFSYAAFFLIATNSITNHFAHNLHGDALAQLATIVAYYLLLVYLETRSRRILAAMILMVPIGFLVKQSLLIWVVWYGGFLALWGKSWKRLAAFAGATAALLAGVLATCYAIWGSTFFYWVFYLFGHHPVSPLRSFQHLLDTWPYYAAGLLGGIAVLRNRRPDYLLGAWLIWLGVMTAEVYTSGIAWMLNHAGPGSLMAGIWFMAGLASLGDVTAQARNVPQSERWIRAGAVTATVALMFNGMGVIRIPLRPVSDDAYRYARDIEKQFDGLPADKILLDVGSWVYIRNRVIMGDRASAIGEEGYANTGDFSTFTNHLKTRRYAKILVRHLHQPDFWYENTQWPRPRGLREAILDNYYETGLIRAAAAPKDVKHWAEDPYLFDEISILEPKPDSSNP